MFNLILRLFGKNIDNKANDKLIKKFKLIVDKINAFESNITQLTNEELKAKTAYFKALLNDNKTLDDLLPEAFAVVRETARRVLGQRHYDVQLMGGIALHNHMIAEMFTGEGKTLVSTLPSYLNALSGAGVHIITVNDYLARRDSAWMGKIFEFLGLTVGVILGDSTEEERKQAYLSDITYGTNNEFGFDYLRDNMKLSVESMIQRPFCYAIIDEVDSVLVDEARTPLIISGASDDKTDLYLKANEFVKFFNLTEDFEIDEKARSINVTESGLEKLEGLLYKSGLVIKGGLFDSQNIKLYHFVVQAIKATYLFRKEVDYIVKEGHVVLIDEFTGRMMDGRRYSEGLHQALEAKEGLKIRQENQTLASITFQNYFKMYPKLSGMTGTAMTESQEFLEIYGLKVVAIPSHRPLSRLDKNDEIYLTYKEKEKAIVNKVIECHQKGQPVLIGTVSIENSELLSKALSNAHIKHHVLNAKHHEQEAYIISQAGTIGAVTIATNMAGRGTDIQLGGNLEMTLQESQYANLSAENLEVATNELKNTINKAKDKVLSVGGLCVIGTERHESRRIDNQLRGRSGRQGEIGISLFYISLEDDLMRIFGSNKLESTLKRLGFKEGEAISHPMISTAIKKAQKRVEQHNFEIRKNLLKFDNVINEQRKVIYGQRKEILNNNIDVITLVKESIEDYIKMFIDKYFPRNAHKSEIDFLAVKGDLTRIFNLHSYDIENKVGEELEHINLVEEEILQLCNVNFQKKIDEVGLEIFTKAFKEITLQLLDYAWKKHLLELDYVRGAINLRSYANKDPFNEYQKESFILFSAMLDEFKERLVSVANHITFEKFEQEQNQKESIEKIDFSKIGRNDPCPCGSGKKYKQCHGL